MEGDIVSLKPVNLHNALAMDDHTSPVEGTGPVHAAPAMQQRELSGSLMRRAAFWGLAK
jgi:hypothetical protein